MISPQHPPLPQNTNKSIIEKDEKKDWINFKQETKPKTMNSLMRIGANFPSKIRRQSVQLTPYIPQILELAMLVKIFLCSLNWKSKNTHTQVFMLILSGLIFFLLYYNNRSKIYDIKLLKYNAVVRLLNLFLRNWTKFGFGKLTEMGPL